MALAEAAELDAAAELLAVADRAPLDELARAHLAWRRAQLAFTRSRGSSDAPALVEAVQQLFSAADTLEPLDAAVAHEVLLEAASAAMYAGRVFGPTRRRETAAALAATPHLDERRPTDLLLRGMVTRIIEGCAAGVAPMRAAVAAIRPDTWSWRAFPIVHEAVVHDLWDDESWHRIATDAVRIGTDAGALAVLPSALVTRAGVHVQAGEFASAKALIADAAALSVAAGQTPVRYHELALAAWVGDEAPATAMIAAAERDGRDRGEGRVIALAGYASAVLHNGLGNYPIALDAARRGCEYEDLGLYGWNLVELVEAAARAGEPAVAAAAMDQLEDRTVAAGTDWALGVRARSRALLSQGSDAEECYVEAIERLTRTRVAVQLARARLLYGEWLRRENRRSDARAELRSAHEMFVGFGAEAFADRARRELLATGEKARKRPAGSGDALTPQERQIAELAGAGLTNPEIGARLFISPHTVEWHLRKVFTKLGVRSRRELRGARR